MMQRHGPGPWIPLSKVVGVPARPHASANIERDSLEGINGYIPNASASKAMDIFSAGLGKGIALSIVGPYGSGKSTFGVILSQLAAPRRDAGWKAAYGMLHGAAPETAARVVDGRRHANLHERGMIRCIATARLEPVAATMLRAAAGGAVSYFGRSYGRRHFAEAGTLRRCAKSLNRGIVPDAATTSRIIASMAASAPVLLVIDEFGKNIEYFAGGGGDGDLFLLQDLAEMSGGLRGVPLHMVTMQHMAFGEYVSGTSAVRAKEWAKIQGRFEMVHFSNSLEHTRALLSSSLELKTGTSHRIIKWAIQHTRAASKEGGVDIPAELAASCYPIHPLAVEALPELCSRYGQNDRTLLSFVFGSGPGTVARFIETERWNGSGPLPTMGADHLYDYFISGAAPARAGAAASSSRLLEIDTIIRDDHVSDETERRVLKAIGLMNLIGRSGRLRASMGMIRCMAGNGAEQAIRSLESRSVITYRRHADEYRVWHGTDVNISAKVDALRKEARRMPYPVLMETAMDPEPVIAARHGIKTGTLRVFRPLFDIPREGVGREYDGAAIYGTVDTAAPTSEKPVIVSRCKDISGLVEAAAEVAALRAVLKEDDISGDWVARGEVGERLAAAENALGAEFDRAYGAGATWTCKVDGRDISIQGTASSAASAASDTAYPDAPPIHNEMINRNKLTAQGSMALNRLMHRMMANEGKEGLGLRQEGWKPERAIYEAIIGEHRVHRQADGAYRFSRPGRGLRGAWNAALSHMRGTRKMVVLTEIYHIWKMPPYGIKDGVMPILALLIILAKRDNVALYEHGSYVSRLSAGLAERLVKNPGHFSLKYYHRSRYRAALIRRMAESLGVDPQDGMLGVVGHLVRVVRSLPTYTRRTKNISRGAQAVRNAIQNAIEPDVLLFGLLPEALGLDPSGRSTDRRAGRFAGDLADAVGELQMALDSMMEWVGLLLFKETGIPDRTSLARAASKLLPDVSDQKMKVFLAAVSADIPDDKAWISYVGLALTDVPPADWSDEHRVMFENGLREAASTFRRLAALRFAAVSDSFGGPSVMVTITHSDGREERAVLPADDKRVAGLTG